MNGVTCSSCQKTYPQVIRARAGGWEEKTGTFEYRVTLSNGSFLKSQNTQNKRSNKLHGLNKAAYFVKLCSTGHLMSLILPNRQ
jgi:ribosomal protein L15E